MIQYRNHRAVRLLWDPNCPPALEPQKLRERALPPWKILLSGCNHCRAVDMPHLDRLRPPSGQPRRLANAQLRHRRRRYRRVVLGHFLVGFGKEVVQGTGQTNRR